ncbi:MAG: hypothetical protein GKC06_02735 [Methanomicrobiales archaeon]|nr:hypothetical protein [Methanomicrobiales archaeon]
MPVSAAILPPPALEIQGVKIVTSVDGIGSITYDSELQWSLSNEILGANLFPVTDPQSPNDYIWVIGEEPPLNDNGEVQSHITYSEDTQANMGIISYRKTSEVTTEPLAGAQYNVWNERMITFTGIDAGTLLSSEDMTMYNVGTCTLPTLSTCPFLCCDCMVNPAFCSRIETGSNLDMSRVAAYLAGGFRNVNEVGDSEPYPPIPSVDGPALAKYTVQVTEMGQGKPSFGTVSTYLKISELDSDADPSNPSGIDPQKDLMQRMEVSEIRSIKGDIDLFDYHITYESKISQDSCCGS